MSYISRFEPMAIIQINIPSADPNETKPVACSHRSQGSLDFVKYWGSIYWLACLGPRLVHGERGETQYKSSGNHGWMACCASRLDCISCCWCVCVWRKVRLVNSIVLEWGRRVMGWYRGILSRERFVRGQSAFTAEKFVTFYLLWI